MILLLICLLCCLTVQAQEKYEAIKLPPHINTSQYDEISPVLNKDGSTLLFTRVGSPDFDPTLMQDTRDMSQILSKEDYINTLGQIYRSLGYQGDNPVGSKFNQDIWIASGANFSSLYHPEYPLNNALPNSACGLMPDGQHVVVINQFERNGTMKKGFSLSRKGIGRQFSFPKPIYIESYENVDTDVGLTVGYRGNTMILSVATTPENHDLYVSFKRNEYSWSAPVSLGPVINTGADEITPFLFLDNLKLYFASNRDGNFDIYETKRLDKSWQNWSTPIKLQQPINSAADETQPFYVFASGKLYFASTRDGSSDIFSVQLHKPIKETVTVQGKVIDKKTKLPVPNATIYQSAGGSTFFNELLTTTDGFFSLEVPKGYEHSFYALKEGYLEEIRSIGFKKGNVYFKDYEIVLPVEKIEKGTHLQVKPIYFERATATIMEKSWDSLDELADFLKQNKNLYITIEGHTDNQGDPSALLRLSKARAEAIKEYLVYQKFLKPVRMSTIGKGDSEPLNDNIDEEQRKKNRRVEIIVEAVSTLR